MSKSSEMEIEHKEEIGNVVQQFIYRVPKKNHEAMVQLEKQFVDVFRKHGGLHYEVFQLSSTENMMEWTNIAKTMSANQDEEIGLSKFTIETANSEMNIWQCVEKMKIWSDVTNSLWILLPQDLPSWVSSTAWRSR